MTSMILLNFFLVESTMAEGSTNDKTAQADRQHYVKHFNEIHSCGNFVATRSNVKTRSSFWC